MSRVAIIGAGLAGTACAYVLKQAGLKSVIYEAGSELAGGASGNPIGLYNPRMSAHRTPESDFYTSAFALALRTFQELDDIDWNRCGSLHLITDEKREKQLAQTIENWGWGPDHMQHFSAAQASDVAGVELSHEALYLKDSGTVSPQKLCSKYAANIEVHLNSKISRLSDIEEDVVVLACGMGVRKFEETRDLTLAPVRGQVTQVKATSLSEKLQCNLCHKGYILPAKDGVHMLGATFQQGDDDPAIRDEDDRDNIAALAQIMPDIAQELEVSGHWAGVRTTSKDHFPVVGRVHDHKDLYVSTAHSAHGVIGSIAAAHLIADMILERPLSQSKDVVQTLNPGRF